MGSQRVADFYGKRVRRGYLRHSKGSESTHNETGRAGVAALGAAAGI